MLLAENDISMLLNYIFIPACVLLDVAKILYII